MKVKRKIPTEIERIKAVNENDLLCVTDLF